MLEGSTAIPATPNLRRLEKAIAQERHEDLAAQRRYNELAEKMRDFQELKGPSPTDDEIQIWQLALNSAVAKRSLGLTPSPLQPAKVPKPRLPKDLVRGNF